MDLKVALDLGTFVIPECKGRVVYIENDKIFYLVMENL